MLELTTLHPHGVFLRREALAHGYDDKQLRSAYRSGIIERVRHGAYVASDVWHAADTLERYRLLCHATLESHGPDVVLSHTSAAAMHGLALWNADIRQVHLTRLDQQTTRQSHDVKYHRGTLPDGQIERLESGRLVCTPARAALEHASLAGVEQGMVVLDSYLHLFDRGSRDSMEEIRQTCRNWPGTAKLQIALRLARPGAESVGESRLRFLCWEYHLPEPDLQVKVVDAGGRLIGTTDFGWPDHRVLGEFDGKVKYEAYLRPGESPADVVFREKQREDRIRERTGFAMIRFVWADLSSRRTTAQRIRRALGLS